MPGKREPNGICGERLSCAAVPFFVDSGKFSPYNNEKRGPVLDAAAFPKPASPDRWPAIEA
jgi:hypothetical protein